MKRNPECLACQKYGPPKWNPSTMKFDHSIPYGPNHTDKVLDCPASIIDGRWKYGKRLDQ